MPLLLDGVALDDPAFRWYCTNASSVRNPPAVTVNDVKIEGLHGVIPALTGTYEVGSCVLAMALQGATWLDVLANFNTLNRMIKARRGLRTLLDAPYAAQVQYVSSSALQRYKDGGQVTYTLSIPSGFWRDQAATTVDLGTGAGTMTPAALQGGSAPIVDPVWVAVGNGAATDFKVTDVESGTWLRWAGTVPAGQSVRVEPRTQSAFLVASASPWSGGTDASGLLTLGPGQFVLTENVAFTIAKTGATGTQVRAQRAYQ